MDIFIYLFKVNVAIILLYGFYRLLLQKDTFFQWKRIILLALLFVSILYPFWDIFRQMIREYTLEETVQNTPFFPTYLLSEIVIVPASPAEGQSTSWRELIPRLLTVIYLLTAGVLLFRIVVQLVTLLRLRIKSEATHLLGRKVYICKGLRAPFSFFSWIVLDPALYSEKELEEILLHEIAHVDQYHSADLFIAELLCAFCWFNPFVWLLKQEIRINLEYLADRSVVASGCDTEHYQFHLLRLSYHKAAAKITNNFNVSPLKKRIQMMNKRETPLLGLCKYLLFLPLVGGLLLFNSLDVMSSDRIVPEMEPVTGIVHTLVPDMEPVAPEVPLTSPSPEPKTPQNDKKEDALRQVDEPPVFPGGTEALVKWLGENLKYPISAQEAAIQGRVVIRFIVEADGKISDVVVLRSLETACDAEAVRAVSSMPLWIPGKQSGKPVRVYYTLPVIFKLTKENVSATKKEPLFKLDGVEMSQKECLERIKDVDPTRVVVTITTVKEEDGGLRQITDIRVK